MSTFLKPAWFHIQMSEESSTEAKLNRDLISVSSILSGLNLSKQDDDDYEKAGSSDSDERQFINDELLKVELNKKFDNYLSELTTWNDYLRVKLDLDEIETSVNSLVNKLLDIYYTFPDYLL